MTIVTNPVFQPLVERLQLEFSPLGTVEQFQAVVADPDLWHPRRGFELVARWGMLQTMRPTYELIAHNYRRGETVVAAQVTCLGARIAHDKLGVPLATVHLQPAVFRSVYESPVLPVLQLGRGVPRFLKRLQYYATDRLICDPLLAPEVNRFRAELQLPPVHRILDAWWHSPQRVIGMFPDWYAAAQPDWPPHTITTGFPLWDEASVSQMATDVEDFLRDGPPPVVFTPGSAMHHGHEFFDAAVAACERLKCRAILLSRHAEHLPERLPTGMRHFSYVPFSRILPRSAALVHHGGIGSTAQALAAGIPQLIMPMAHDQFDNAARVERLGVGAAVPRKRFQGPMVATALQNLLRSEHVARRCREAKDLAGQHEPLTEAADEIEKLFGRDVNEVRR